MSFIKPFLKEPENLSGFPKFIVDSVDKITYCIKQIPPISFGIGVGAGCGIALGWELGEVGKHGIGPPKAFLGCGAGVGVGFGLGQGFGRHLTKDNRDPKYKASIEEQEKKFEDWANSVVTAVPNYIQNNILKKKGSE